MADLEYHGPDAPITPHVIINLLDSETNKPIPVTPVVRYETRGEVQILHGGPLTRYNIWLKRIEE